MWVIIDKFKSGCYYRGDCVEGDRVFKVKFRKILRLNGDFFRNGKIWVIFVV